MRVASTEVVPFALPFREPYVIFHTWEMGGSALLIDAMDWHKESNGHFPPGTFMICEAQAVTIGSRPIACFRGGRSGWAQIIRTGPPSALRTT